VKNKLKKKLSLSTSKKQKAPQKTPVSRRITIINVESPYALSLPKKLLSEDIQVCVGVTLQDEDEQPKVDPF